MISSVLFAVVLQILAVHPSGDGRDITMREAVLGGGLYPARQTWHWEGDKPLNYPLEKTVIQKPRQRRGFLYA